MRFITLILSALVLGTTIITPSGAFAAPVQQGKVKKPAANLIQGRVVDANGRAVREALVTIVDENNETVAETRTDNRGFYEISVPETASTSEDYSLRIRRIGYTPITMQLVESNGYWSVIANVTMRQFTMQSDE